MIVVDASVIVTALGDDGSQGSQARGRLASEQLLAPSLVDVEAVSAWRRLTAAGRLAEARAAQAVGDLQVMRLQRVGHQPQLRRCWALRDNLTAHDAAYVALAQQANLVLLTADAKLATAPGLLGDVEVL